MATQPRHPKDPTRVDIGDEWELRYWARELGLAPDALAAAVREVGDSVEALRQRRSVERADPAEGSPAAGRHDL